MKKKLWFVLAIGLVLIVIGLAGCSTTSPQSKTTVTGGIFNSQSTGIWVSGEGKVTAVPDVAILSLGVQAQATTVDQAQNQASASMNAAVNAIKAGGVADKDIQTTAFSIQQLTNYDQKTQQQTIIGYLVTNTVRVKVRNAANAGSIIDAVTKAGGDNTRINSISFTVNDPAPYETSARQLAMADAKAKAKQLADQAGVKLGKPTYINESSGFVPVQTAINSGVSAPVAAPTPISTGTTDITVDVQVTFGID
jgi:uncharacterized protein